MELSKYEQETIINYNEDEDTASVYTYDKKLRKKLESLALKYPDKFTLERAYPHGAATFIVPKRCVSIREPYSDARRAADSERTKKAGVLPPGRGICSQGGQQPGRDG
jgi:hypothetical protein